MKQKFSCEALNLKAYRAYREVAHTCKNTQNWCERWKLGKILRKQYLIRLIFLISAFRGNLVTANVSLGSEEGMIPTLKRNLSGSLLGLQVSLKPLS